MITIVEQHVYSYLIPSPEHEEEVIDLVDKVTSWRVPGAEHSDLFQRGKWDGYQHLLSRSRLRFPSGLVPLVKGALEEQSYEVAVNDNREFPERPELKVLPLNGITLRSDQEDAVRQGWSAGRGVLKAPPGAGKTETMISLVASLGVYPALWLTHTRPLLKQTYKRFRQRLSGYQVKVGMIGEGVWRPRDITVAMVQTLSSKAKKKETTTLLQTMKTLVGDEVHHAPARQWYKLIMNCPAPFRFGCSATPLDRHDGSDLRLIGAVGDIFYEFTVEQGHALGVFALPRVVFVDYDLDGVTRSTGWVFEPWQQVYREGIVTNEKRNNAVLRVCQGAVREGRRVLLLVREIAHGRLLYEHLCNWFDCSSHVIYIHGTDPSPVRDRAIKKFRKGVCKVLIASSILDEGADVPEIDTVVIASAGKSAIKGIQRIGRGMRRMAGKELVVYDFVDRHAPVLLRHSKMRKRVYQQFSSTKAEIWKL